MEYLHPLSIEGFCVDGLLDYQFSQTSKDSFEMAAELSSPAAQAKVSSEIMVQMKTLLRKNGLEDIRFSIRFVEHIMPDIHTGKKLLIAR